MSEKKGRPEFVNCDGYLMAPGFSPEAFRSVVNYKPRPGDLFIVTYPRCGTTWMQFIVMGIIRKGKPIKSTMEYRLCSPFLEMMGIDVIDLMKEKGAFKTHLPLHLIPMSPESKYIYVARNPKDCCVSFYHHTRSHALYDFEDGTFDEFFELFINGKVECNDYFDHLLPWYNRRNDCNVHFVTYENMLKDTKSEVLKVAKFVGEEYYKSVIVDSKQLQDILHYSSVDYMREVLNKLQHSLTNNSETSDLMLPSGFKHVQEIFKTRPVRNSDKGQFIRKGIVGDWKGHFSPEQEERMEEWIQRKTEGSDVMNLWKNSQV